MTAMPTFERPKEGVEKAFDNLAASASLRRHDDDHSFDERQPEQPLPNYCDEVTEDDDRNEKGEPQGKDDAEESSQRSTASSQEENRHGKKKRRPKQTYVHLFCGTSK